MIDSEDIIGLYSQERINYENIVLDQSGQKLNEFKEFQAVFFKQILKDAIYNYRNNMLTEEKDKIKYIEYFYKEMDWELSEDTIQDLLTFDKFYQTYEGSISMMMDCD